MVLTVQLIRLARALTPNVTAVVRRATVAPYVSSGISVTILPRVIAVGKIADVRFGAASPAPPQNALAVAPHAIVRPSVAEGMSAVARMPVVVVEQNAVVRNVVPRAILVVVLPRAVAEDPDVLLLNVLHNAVEGKPVRAPPLVVADGAIAIVPIYVAAESNVTASPMGVAVGG